MDTSRFRVVPDFFAGAKDARAAVDAARAWSYSFGPRHACFKTDADNVLPADLADRFCDALVAWSARHLGLAEASFPSLTTYVSGCHEGFASDPAVGQFGYAYSLGRPGLVGGEDLLLREEPFFGSARFTMGAPAAPLHDTVAPAFDQLLVWDARVPHAVARVEGSMDPAAGRVVLAGTLRAGPPIVDGDQGARGEIQDAASRARARLASLEPPCHGFLAARLAFDAGGAVAEAEILCNRLLSLDERRPSQQITRIVLSELCSLRLPGVRSFVCPICIGGVAGEPAARASRAGGGTQRRAAPLRFTPEMRRFILRSVHSGTGVEGTVALLMKDGHDRPWAETAVAHSVDGTPDPDAAPMPEPRIHGASPVRRIGDREITVLAAMDTPRVVLLGGVMTPDECDLLIDRARSKLKRSMVIDNLTGEDVVVAERTSHHAELHDPDDAFLVALEERFHALVGWPREKAERLQVTHYPRNAYYKPHHDFFAPAALGSAGHLARGGNRLATLIVYLTTPEGGGATEFPEVGLDVVAVRGNALFFSYATPSVATRTYHGGAPVTRGEKWIVTRWFRAGTPD